MSDLISKSELLKKFSVDSNGNKIPEYDVDNFPVTLPISEVKEIIRKAQTTSDKEIRDKAIEEFKNTLPKQEVVDKSVVRRITEQMKDKEVIQALKKLFSEHELALPNTDSLGVLHEAVRALEKQIPKKVNARKIMKDFHGKPYAIKGDCPSCGMIEILSVNTDYCHCCGQKLDWSGESN